MIRTFLSRGLILAAVLLSSLLLTHGTARALSEFCPARSNGFDQIGGPTSNLYAFSVSAQGTRTVSGTIIVKAESGWFRVPFTDAKLNAHLEHWKDKFVGFDRRVFDSDTMYVRFPQPVTVLASYVSDAKTNGDPYFGWDSQGDVACSPPAGFSLRREARPWYDDPPSANLTFLGPTPAPVATPGPDTPVATASLTSVPGSIACATPFTDVDAVHLAKLHYPRGSAAWGTSGDVWVALMIDSSGALADAWVLTPSGDKDIDAAALDGAKRSTFHAGTAFCQAAPGVVLYRADFHVRP